MVYSKLLNLELFWNLLALDFFRKFRKALKLLRNLKRTWASYKKNFFYTYNSRKI